MKDWWMRVVVTGVVVVLVGAADDPPYLPMLRDPQDNNNVGGYWYNKKPAPLLPATFLDPHTKEWQQRWVKMSSQKRGFGSMMPAYLLQLYRPDQPNLNPSDLFSSSRPTSERGKIGYGNRRG